jgi:hypothetical protein
MAPSGCLAVLVAVGAFCLSGRAAAQTAPTSGERLQGHFQQLGLRLELEQQPAANRDALRETLRKKWTELKGQELVEGVCRVLNPPNLVLVPAPGFADKVLLEAGDPGKMSRGQLDSLRTSLASARIRDQGLALDLAAVPYEQRAAASPALVEKWSNLRGESLRSEYYAALLRSLRRQRTQALAKRPSERGSVDELLAKTAVENLSRYALDELSDDLQQAARRDWGLTLEMGQFGPGLPKPLRPGLQEKWAKLRGEALATAYYQVVIAALAHRQQQVLARAPSDPLLSDFILVTAEPVEGLSRAGIDDLAERFRKATHCDNQLIARRRTGR